MIKKLLLMAFAALLLVGFSSCKKMGCYCVGYGPGSEEIVDKYYKDCVKLADEGTIIEEGDVTVVCKYD